MSYSTVNSFCHGVSVLTLSYLSFASLFQPLPSVTAERLIASPTPMDLMRAEIAAASSPRPKTVTERDAAAQGLFPDVFHIDSTTIGPELVTPTKVRNTQ